MTSDPELAGAPLVRSAAGAVLTTAATNAALAIIALSTGVLAARLLGPAGRGQLAAAQAVGTLVGAIGSLSLGEALVFFVGRRTRPPMVVLKTATFFATAATTILIGAAVLSMPRLLAGQPDAVGAARTYTLIGLPFVLLGFPITFMRALQRYGLWNVLRLIAPLSWFSALLLFTFTGRGDVQPLVLVFLLLQLLFVPLVWLLAGSHNRSTSKLDLSLILPMLRYGTPLFLATLPMALNLRLDQLLIANFESATQLGVYAVSVSWAAIGLPIMAAIGSILFPRLAGMAQEEAAVALARCSRVGVAIALLIGALSAFSAPRLVPLLFGRAFSPPIAVPVVLAAATSILGLNDIIEEGLRGLGEPRSVLLAELVGLVATIGLLLALLPGFGITGAAIASLGGYSVVNAILVWRTKNSFRLSASMLIVPKRSDIRGIIDRGRAMTTRRTEKGGQ